LEHDKQAKELFERKVPLEHEEQVIFTPVPVHELHKEINELHVWHDKLFDAKNLEFPQELQIIVPELFEHELQSVIKVPQLTQADPSAFGNKELPHEVHTYIPEFVQVRQFEIVHEIQLDPAFDK